MPKKLADQFPNEPQQLDRANKYKTVAVLVLEVFVIRIAAAASL